MKLNVGHILKMEQSEIIKEFVHKDMTMGEILQKSPSTVEVMQRYGLHCFGCHISTWETLEQGILGHGGTEKEVENMIKEINESIKKQKFSNNVEIALTEKAANKLKEIMKQNPEKTGLRIQVSPGGCAGFSYDFTLVENPNHNEKVIDQLGVKVYINGESLNLIGGSKIDYVDALQGAGFKVFNPKATSTCGCGQSFS